MDGQEAAAALEVEPHGGRLCNLAAHAGAEEGIRRGMEDIEAQRG